MFETESLNVGQEQVFELAKTDLNFFSALALPYAHEYNYPDFYCYSWSLLTEKLFLERDFSKFALGLPRGFSKTSFAKLLATYAVLYSNKSFILVLAATEGHAVNFIADIAETLSEPNIIATFGNWRANISRDTQAVKTFDFRGRNITLAAIGQGGSVRGLNIKHKRPDFMIFDDIQTREEAESQQVSEAILKWMLGTAMKAASHKGCMYLFLANMYSTPHSILKKLKANPEWIKLIAGGILLDGTSLWEELKPLKQLIVEYNADLLAGHPEIFASEVLNDEEAALNNLIDLSKLPAYPYTKADESMHTGSFIIIDPSNDKANSDAVSIAAFLVIDTRPVCVSIIEGRLSPLETIEKAISLAASLDITLIFIEANAYQYSLCFWFDKTIEQLDIDSIVAQPIYSGSRAKSSRILDMFKAWISGEIYVHPSVRSLVLSQARAYQPLRRDNVDGILDCLTYAMRVLSEFPTLVAESMRQITTDEYTPIEMGTIEETSLF